MEIPTGFMEAESSGFYIVTRPVYYRRAVEIAERDPETLFGPETPGTVEAAGPMQGRGRRLELPGEGGETVILKKQRRGGLYGRLRGDIHKDDYRALSDVILSETAWKKGVPVALMAFAMSASAGPGRLATYRRAYSATIKIPGARSLMEWLTAPLSVTERRAVIAAAAHAVNRAHDRGFQHGDLNLGNILVVRSQQGDYSAWLIDLQHSHLGGTLTVKPRVENLVRLYRSAEKWLPEPDERRRFRELVFFMRQYARGDAALVRQYLEAARHHRTSLFLHRLGWKASGVSARRRSPQRAGTPPQR